MDHSASQPPMPEGQPPLPPPQESLDPGGAPPPLPPSPGNSSRSFQISNHNENPRDPLLGGNFSYISSLDGVLGDEVMSNDDSDLHGICDLIKPLDHDVDSLVGFDKTIVDDVDYGDDVDSPFTTNSSQENTLDFGTSIYDTNSDGSSCPFSMTPTSNQLTMRGLKRMDFEPDDGENEDQQQEEEEEEEIGEPPEKQARVEDTTSENENTLIESNKADENSDTETIVQDVKDPETDQNKTDNEDSNDATARKGIEQQNALNTDFQVIDDIGSDQDEVGDRDGASGSEDEWVQDDDIDAMLDEPVKDYKEKNITSTIEKPEIREKVILIEKYQDPFDIMPEGWIMVTHDSGMPIYLHKETRTITLSKPYFIGKASVRRHDIPLSSIPCLSYTKALQRDKEKEEKIRATHGNDADKIFAELNRMGVYLTGDPSKNGCPAKKGNESSKNGSDPKENSKDNANTGDKENQEMTDKEREEIKMKAIAAGVNVNTAEEYHKEKVITPEQLTEYCRSRFHFKTITVKRFRSWKDRRRHAGRMMRGQTNTRPTISQGNANLIKCSSALQNPKVTYGESKRIREVILNPTGKSDVCLLHEYVQHALRIQPKFVFAEIENAQTPYSATVVIGDTKYGTAYGSSKKIAKSQASRITLEVLLPDILKVRAKEKDGVSEEQDLSFFDDVKIEDVRVTELCKKAGQPSPFAILEECVKRNHGLKELKIEMDMEIVRHQRSEFKMKVGKHETVVVCKNKREGKQRASQMILKLMHPHIHCWGSLLRLYGNQRAFKEKKAAEMSITSLQTQSVQPNKAILNKLKEEMLKLHEKRDSMEIRMKGKFEVETAGFKFAEPNMVDA